MQIEVDGGSCIGTIYHNGKATVMMVDSVEVDIDKRNKGIGTKLMKKVIEVAKANYVDSVELVVNSNNDIAKKLYHKAGFKKTNKEHHRLILRHFGYNNTLL